MEQNKDNIITGEYHGSEAAPEKCRGYRERGARMSEDMVREWFIAQRQKYDGTVSSLNLDTLPEPDAVVACFGEEAMVYFSTCFRGYFIHWRDFEGMDYSERLRITAHIREWVEQMRKKYPNPMVNDLLSRRISN